MSVNNPMQFSHLESTPPLVCRVSWSQSDWWIIVLLFEQLNKHAFNLWKKSLDDLSPGYHTSKITSLSKSYHNPTPNSHFVSTQKSVGLYSAHCGNWHIHRRECVNITIASIDRYVNELWTLLNFRRWYRLSAIILFHTCGIKYFLYVS